MPEIKLVEIGMFNLFIKHSTASITINENYDPDVRDDMNIILSKLVPEDNKLYKHTSEGLFRTLLLFAKERMICRRMQNLALLGLFCLLDFLY